MAIGADMEESEQTLRVQPHIFVDEGQGGNPITTTKMPLTNSKRETALSMRRWRRCGSDLAPGWLMRQIMIKAGYHGSARDRTGEP